MVGSERGFNLVVLQILNYPRRASLEWDREDALAVLEMLWARAGHVAEEGVNRGQAYTARGRPVAARLLDVSQKREDDIPCEHVDVKPRHRRRPLCHREAEQERETVPVAVDRMRAGPSDLWQVLGEKPAERPRRTS